MLDSSRADQYSISWRQRAFDDPQLQEPLARLWEAASLVLMVLAAWEVVRRLAVRLVEESLTVRAQQPETWPVCGRCGRRLQSKGFHPRTLRTLFGGDPLVVAGGTVSEGLQGLAGCAIGSGVGVGVPHQRTGAEVQWMGCLLAVFVPYETARRLLQQLTGVELAAGTLWGWVQQVGQRAMVQLEGELRALAAGNFPAVESLTAELEALPLVIGADGVMVPFRPRPRTSTAPPHVEGENPVAGDQSGDSGPPARAAEPKSERA